MLEEAKRQLKINLAREYIHDFIRYTFRQYRRESWHHKLMASYYQRILSREITRLMIFAPPRHMKTEALERAITFALGENPHLKIIVTAYSAAKASKISKHINQNIKDSRLSEVFSDFRSLQFSKDTEMDWTLSSPGIGGLLAAGVGGPITGEGFEIGIIDDPVKSREEAESITFQEKNWEWYQGTFLNRQNETDSAIILTNTRWHPNDLSGRILEQDGILEYNGQEPSDGCPEWNGQPDGKWVVLSLPALMDTEAFEWKHPDDPREIGEALWPARYPIAFLEQFQRNLYNWNSLYQQRPKRREGNLIQRAWFKIVDEIPKQNLKLLRFWDFAGTPKDHKKQNNPDFTAGALLALCGGDLYILDIQAFRESPSKVEQRAIQTAEQDEKLFGQVTQVWEEEGGAGGKLITEQYNRIFSKYVRRPFRSGHAKEFYIDRLANKAETGNVYCVNGKWLHERCEGMTFFDEAEGFPKANHDDRIDAAAKAAYLLTGGSEPNIRIL